MSPRALRMLSLLALFALFALVVVGPAVPSSFAGEAVRVWSYAATERGVGFSGVVAAPSESDGRLEVYFGATTADFGPSEFFVALEHDEVSDAYDQVFVSEPLDPPIRRIAVGNVTGDARLELVTLHEDGEVRSWDRSTWEVVSSFDSSPSPMNLDFVLADVEGDAREEVLLLADGILRVFDGIGTLSWEAPTAGRYLTAGQMDEDPSMEIAIGSGEVFDAASRTEQWRFPSTFNARVIAADVDDDGRDEVLRVDSEIEAFDVDLEANAWTIPEQGFAIEVGELDGDPALEIAVATSTSGTITVFDAVTLEEEAEIRPIAKGTAGIALGDADDDGLAEIFLGGLDALYVLDPLSGEIEWQSPSLGDPFLGPVRGNIDGDPGQEIVIASLDSDRGFSAGRLAIFDEGSRSLLAVSFPFGFRRSPTGTQDLRLRDVDHDGDLEMLIATDTASPPTPRGLLEAWDFDRAKGFTRIFASVLGPLDEVFVSVDAADLEGDGDVEVVGVAGRYVYAYDLATGALEWQSLQMGVGPRAETVAVIDADDDGDLDVVAQLEDGVLYVFDGTTKLLEHVVPGSFRGMEILGPVGPPWLGLIEGDDRLVGYRFDGSDYAADRSVTLGGGRIEGFVLGPRQTILVGSEGRLRIHRIPNPEIPIWESDDFGAGFGRRSVVIEPGRRIFTAGSYMLAEFHWQP